jgi:hypothetical protein
MISTDSDVSVLSSSSRELTPDSLSTTVSASLS